MDQRRAANREAVFAACRRLQGVRELTATNLAEATGLSLVTCRTFRAELLKDGLIRKTWRTRRKGGSARGVGVDASEDAVIQDRIARVRSAKRLAGEAPVAAWVLERILPH